MSADVLLLRAVPLARRPVVARALRGWRLLVGTPADPGQLHLQWWELADPAEPPDALPAALLATRPSGPGTVQLIAVCAPDGEHAAAAHAAAAHAVRALIELLRATSARKLVASLPSAGEGDASLLAAAGLGRVTGLSEIALYAIEL
ncbi:MAG TPA: hypothetical protein VHS54_10260 [Jatrophihabitans sp.]|nr:hypothetical protein [Jatrophihabitans sp.]